MTVLRVDAVWLNDTELCSLEEMVRRSGLTAAEVAELAHAGALATAQAANETAGAVTFHVSAVTLARRARRLRDDFELDVSALCVAARLLQRIVELERELDDLHAHHPHHPRKPDTAG